MSLSWFRSLFTKHRQARGDSTRNPKHEISTDLGLPKKNKTPTPVNVLKAQDPEHRIFIDLGLPKNKTPANVNVLQSSFESPRPVEDHINDYAIGSSNGEEVCYKQDLGLFKTALEVWKNHWVLRTRPDDWWFPVACRIAKAIDKEAQREDASNHDTNKPVRNFFVGHEGKKTIEKIPVFKIE